MLKSGNKNQKKAVSFSQNSEERIDTHRLSLNMNVDLINLNIVPFKQTPSNISQSNINQITQISQKQNSQIFEVPQNSKLNSENLYGNIIHSNLIKSNLLQKSQDQLQKVNDKNLVNDTNISYNENSYQMLKNIKNFEMFDNFDAQTGKMQQSGRTTQFMIDKQVNKKMNDQILRHLQYGGRPVYGFPHMNFKEKNPKKIEDFIKIKEQNWRLISRSILRSDQGKSEIQQILQKHFKEKQKEERFLSDMQKRVPHKRNLSAEITSTITSQCKKPSQNSYSPRNKSNKKQKGEPNIFQKKIVNIVNQQKLKSKIFNQANQVTESITNSQEHQAKQKRSIASSRMIKHTEKYNDEISQFSMNEKHAAKNMKRLSSMFDINRMKQAAENRCSNSNTQKIKYNHSFINNLQNMKREEYFKEKNKLNLENIKFQKLKQKSSPIQKYINEQYRQKSNINESQIMEQNKSLIFNSINKDSDEAQENYTEQNQFLNLLYKKQFKKPQTTSQEYRMKIYPLQNQQNAKNYLLSDPVQSSIQSPNKSIFKNSIHQELDRKITFLDQQTGEISFVNTSEKNSLYPLKAQICNTNDMTQNKNISMLQRKQVNESFNMIEDKKRSKSVARTRYFEQNNRRHNIQMNQNLMKSNEQKPSNIRQGAYSQLSLNYKQKDNMNERYSLSKTKPTQTNQSLQSAYLKNRSQMNNLQKITSSMNSYYVPSINNQIQSIYRNSQIIQNQGSRDTQSGMLNRFKHSNNQAENSNISNAFQSSNQEQNSIQLRGSQTEFQSNKKQIQDPFDAIESPNIRQKLNDKRSSFGRMLRVNFNHKFNLQNSKQHIVPRKNMDLEQSLLLQPERNQQFKSHIPLQNINNYDEILLPLRKVQNQLLKSLPKQKLNSVRPKDQFTLSQIDLNLNQSQLNASYMQSGETSIQNFLKRKEFENHSQNFQNKDEPKLKKLIQKDVSIKNLQNEHVNQSLPTNYLNEKSLTEESQHSQSQQSTQFSINEGVIQDLKQGKTCLSQILLYKFKNQIIQKQAQ